MIFRILTLLFLATGSMYAQTKVLAISGSTRKDSLNKKLLMEAVQIAKQKGAEVTVFDFKENPFPFFDADLEEKQGIPKNVKTFRKLMLQSDVVMIASPEYNGSISGVLKNAIDWATRSEEGPTRAAFQGKKFLIMSASVGEGGGSRGLTQLRTILTNVGGDVSSLEVKVPNAQEELKKANAPYKQELQEMINSVIK